MKNITVSRILLIIFAVIILFIIVNGFIENKKSFEEMIFGIVQKKIRGSKGSIILILKKNQESSDQIKYSFGDTRSIYHEIEIGDSVVKPANSYMLYLYRELNDKHIIHDSIEIYHW